MKYTWFLILYTMFNNTYLETLLPYPTYPTYLILIFGKSFYHQSKMMKHLARVLNITVDKTCSFVFYLIIH